MKQEEQSVSGEYVTAAYICVSVLLFMLLCLLVYVTCSKRFQLNWFEKTQLDAAKNIETQPIVASPAPVGPPWPPTEWAQTEPVRATISTSNGTRRTRILRSQSSGPLDSPSSASKEFWVPVSIQRQASFCQSDGPNEFSGEDSAPDTPNTPLGIKVSPFALSHMSQPERGVSPLVKSVQPPSQAISRPKVITMYGKLDHTKINANLYQEEKKNSVEGLEEGPGGILTLTVTYTPQYSLLCVHLIKAQNLVAKDVSSTADPYAKVRLLPDTTTWRETSTQWKTLNPTFDEELVFDLPEPELKNRTLEILIFDYDHYSRHQCLGRVEIPLRLIDLQQNAPICKPIFFSDQKDDKPDIGDLMFSLGYLQSAERLTVVVLKARNLKSTDESKTTFDPYVKVAISHNGRRMKKKKTTIQRGTANPVFNEALSFNNITKDMLKNLTLEISVMNENILGQNDVLGSVIIGPFSKGEEAVHRRNVLASKPAVAMWHSLTLSSTPTMNVPQQTE